MAEPEQPSLGAEEARKRRRAVRAQLPRLATAEAAVRHLQATLPSLARELADIREKIEGVLPEEDRDA